MRKKVTVIGAHDTARSIAEHDYADVVESVGEMAGSDVVVVTDAGSAAAIARHAPAAVVVVDGDAEVCADVLAGTLFPRARVVGVAEGGVEPLVAAAVLDRRRPLPCLAAAGADGRFGPATVRLGARGIEGLAPRTPAGA